MPIYEYECGKCGVFEQSQRISDPALTKCPTCRRKVRRLISNTSFQLKGSGWYVTDYARKGNGGAAKKDEGGTSASSETKNEGGKSESAKSDGGKAESKAESKAEAKPSAGSSAKSDT